MAAPTSDAFTIRPLRSIAEFDACREVQRKAWGYRDLDIVPTTELVSVEKAGGLVLGAFGPEGRLAGFCFGLVGRDHERGTVYHYSRMVGVDPDYRGRGIAQALKRAQRDAVLAQGIDLMRWTFDPLAAPNAALNLSRLGAEAIGYIRDMFGAGTSSPLHAAGTDRLLCEWRLRGERRQPDPEATRIPIPADIADLRKDPAEAQRVRFRVREGFERAFAAGRIAVDFQEGSYLFASATTP